MGKFNHPVYEHPETGKVLNPSTENWVTQKYARGIGILQDAKKHTARYFKKLDEKAEEASKKVLNSNKEADEEKQQLDSSSTSEKDQLDETARVSFDEEGNETRIDHDSEADEALGNIMNDIDQADTTGRAVSSEDFVDKDAAQSDQPPANADNVDDYEPEHLNMPSFPGGIYNTKNREKRQQKRRMRNNSNNGPTSSDRGAHQIERNKTYKHTKSGGIKVVKNDDDTDE